MIWLVAFWLSVAFVAYVEVGYPLLLWLVAHFRRVPRPPKGEVPTVTVLIAAHNEEQVIGAKLENTLALDYPPGKLQVIVASDGSTDRTDAIVQGYASRGVLLSRTQARQGKVPALRAAEPLATGEVIVVSDADSRYDPGALRLMVRHFADPAVGAVSGHEIRQAAGQKGRGEGLYCRIDNAVKALEGRIGSQVMVNGGFFAVRRLLLPHVPDHLTHDGVVPTTLHLKGYRTAYEPDAVSTEAYGLASSEDWRRRIRTVLQAIQSYWYVKPALNPLRAGFYAIQIWSHRLFRYLVFPALVVALATSVLMAERSPVYGALAAVQVIGYGLAGVGCLLDRRGYRPLLFYIPYYFAYIHVAAFCALVLALTGRTITTWRPTRREVQPPADTV